jgi:hypothetical protein
MKILLIYFLIGNWGLFSFTLFLIKSNVLKKTKKLQGSFISAIRSKEKLTCYVGKDSNVTSVQCPGGQCWVRYIEN